MFIFIFFFFVPLYLFLLTLFYLFLCNCHFIFAPFSTLFFYAHFFYFTLFAFTLFLPLCSFPPFLLPHPISFAPFLLHHSFIPFLSLRSFCSVFFILCFVSFTDNLWNLITLVVFCS
jgi:hypothetical protein